MQKVDPDAIMNAASADSADSTPTLEETAADAKPPGRKIWTCSMGDDCAYKVHNGRDGKVFAATSDHEVYSAFFRRVMPALLNFAVGSETGPKDLESEVICIHCAAALMKQMIADKKNLEDERICGELNGTTVTIRYPDARPVKLQALGKTIGWLVSEQEKHEAASNAIAERLGSKLAERGNRRGNRGNRRPRQTAKPAAAAPTKPPQRTIEEALADSRNEEAPATAAPAPYVSALDQLATLAVNPEGDLEGDKATI